MEDGAGGNSSHLDEIELFKESTQGSLQIRKLEIDGNHLFTSVQKEMLPSFVIFCKLILRTNSNIYISSRGEKSFESGDRIRLNLFVPQTL